MRSINHQRNAMSAVMAIGYVALTAVPVHAQNDALLDRFGAGSVLDPEVSLNFYLTEPSYSGCGLIDDSALDQCEELEVMPRPGLSLLWIVVSRTDGYPDGISGVGFGVIHSSLGVQSWVNCTGGAIFQGFDWPESGGGLATFWPGACYLPPDENAKIGYFIIDDGEEGLAMLTPNPFFSPSEAQWLNCSSTVWRICELNLAATVLDAPEPPLCGDNCEPVPVQETTWSRIKAAF